MGVAGFSFVEVLIVVTITGILVSLCYFAYASLLGDTKTEKQAIAIHRMEEAKTRYFLDFPNSPDTTIPPLTNLVYYLEITPEVGTNAFYNVRGGLFDGCFPSSKNVYLNPNDKNTPPAFQFY
jgi:type II secretory pathway pseudopilin PulG